MMKSYITAIICALLLGLLGLSTPAQRGGPETRPLRGRVVNVGANAVPTQIAVYYRALRPEAPGNVPAEMAQQIAQMTDMIKRLEQQGKTEAAQRMMRTLQELRCWRQLDTAITDWNGIAVLGMRRVGLDQIAIGMRARVQLEVNGNLTSGALPERGALIRDVEQLAPQSEDDAHSALDPGTRRKTFFDLAGEIVGTRPLVIRVNNARVQVDTSNQYQFIQRAQLTPRDLRAGNRIMLQAMIDPLRNSLRNVRQILILGDQDEFNPASSGDALP